MIDQCSLTHTVNKLKQADLQDDMDHSRVELESPRWELITPTSVGPLGRVVGVVPTVRNVYREDLC